MHTNILPDESWWRAALALCLLAITGAHANEVNPGHLEEVVVTAPLPGAAAAEADVPVNVLRLSGHELAERSPWNLGQALGDIADGVTVNDIDAAVRALAADLGIDAHAHGIDEALL